MNKKSKIIVAIVITILLIILMVIGYTPRDNETLNDEISKIDIQIDNSKLNIFYFYVGEADCTLIMNKGQVMLIDAGEDTEGELIVQFLKKIEVQQIDYLVATHSDDDHIGGMKDIVNSFQIGKLYIPATKADNKSYTDLTKIEGLNLQNVEINQTGTIRRC